MLVDNYKLWESKIKTLDISNKLLDKILSFIKFFGNASYHFKKIKNEQIKKAFLNIKSYKNIYLSFDIEFQSGLIPKSKIKNYYTELNSKGDRFALFPRELGLIIFVRDDSDNVYYIGNALVNFQSITNRGFNELDLKYILETYATVSKDTSKLMKENDKNFILVNEFDFLEDRNLFMNKEKLIRAVDELVETLEDSELFKILSKRNKERVINILHEIKETEIFNNYSKKIRKIKKITSQIPFNVYGLYLKTNLKNKFLDQLNLYNNDSLVKQRMLDSNQEVELIEKLSDISKETCFIVKGKRDLYALKNFNKLIASPIFLDFSVLYDIEIFNGFSKVNFKDAKLETTYDNLIKYDIYKNNFEEMEKIKKVIEGIAHNPLVDSYYTLVVALVINMGLNEYFSQINMDGGNTNVIEWFYKYVEMKNKYLSLQDRLL